MPHLIIQIQIQIPTIFIQQNFIQITFTLISWIYKQLYTLILEEPQESTMLGEHH